MTKNNNGKYNFDIYGLNKRFSDFEKRVNGSGMSPENKKLTVSFKKKAYAAGLMGKQRILKYEVFFKNYDALLKKPFNKATKDDLQEVVSYIKDRDDWKEATKNDFLRLLRRYYKIDVGMQDEHEHPDLVKWIKIKKEKQPPINWEEVPHWDDILKMVEFTPSVRNRALVKSIWEAGSRIGEHLTLRIGDVEEVEHGLYLNIRVSKTELRKVFIRLSAPDLLEWLSVHPLRHDKEAPLFCRLNGGNYTTVLGHRYVYKMIQLLKEHAGIEKEIYPHMLRHGSASYFSDFLSDSDMDYRLGWKDGETKRRYTHKNIRSQEDKILKMAGFKGDNGAINIYDEAEEGRIECNTCHKMNPKENKVCFNCRRLLDVDMAEAVQRLKNKADNFSMAYIEKNPAALRDFVGFLSKEAEKRLIREGGGVTPPSP